MSESADKLGEAEVSDRPGPRVVHRALEVLTRVIEDGPASLAELANAAELPASTTLRLLRALEYWQFVTRLPENRYAVGVRLVKSTIYIDPAEAQDLAEIAAPILRDVTRATQETSYLAIPGPRGTCAYLREEQTTQPVRYVGSANWVGRVVEMVGSAVGEVFDDHVPATGYCVQPAVLTPDATVIAAPVTDADGKIIAALSVAGPAFRMDEESIRRHGSVLIRAAQELALEISRTKG